MTLLKLDEGNLNKLIDTLVNILYNFLCLDLRNHIFSPKNIINKKKNRNKIEIDSTFSNNDCILFLATDTPSIDIFL